MWGFPPGSSLPDPTGSGVRVRKGAEANTARGYTPTKFVSFPSQAGIKARWPPTVSDRTGRFRPASLAPKGQVFWSDACPARTLRAYCPVAEARSTVTPGPIVDDSETFFM